MSTIAFIKVFSDEKEAEVFAAKVGSKVVRRYDYDIVFCRMIVEYVVRY